MIGVLLQGSKLAVTVMFQLISGLGSRALMNLQALGVHCSVLVVGEGLV